MEVSLDFLKRFSTLFMSNLKENIYGTPVVGKAVPFSADKNAICFYYVNARFSLSDGGIDVGVYARFTSEAKATERYSELLEAANKIIHAGGPDGNLAIEAESDIGYANTDKNGNATHMVIIFSLEDVVDDC